jgi:hypothetical protein
VGGHRGAVSSGQAGACAAAAGLLALLLAGCTLLFPLELTVARWSPDSASPDPATVAVWVEFSADVDATSAEQGFTLTENGSPVRGTFSWAGRRLLFQPLAPVSAGKDYVICVSSSVEGAGGVSLEREFRFPFCTRAETARPRVLSVEPPAGSTIDDRYRAVVVRFSEAMDTVSVLRGVSISPPLPGAFSWSPDGTAVSFTPAEPYQWQTEYTARLDGSAADTSGNSLGEEREWRFLVGTDGTPPVLLEVRCHDGTAAGSVVAAVDDPADTGLTVTAGWESTWGVQLSFSEPVSRESLVQCVSLEPACPLSIRPEADVSQAFTLLPAERLPWDALCTLTVRGGVTDMCGNATVGSAVVHLRTDGPRSRPPRVAMVRFRGTPVGQPALPVDLDPSVSLAVLPVSAVDFPVGAARSSWLDLHLSLADGAGLDILSAAEHLVIAQTGGCLSMAAVGVQAAGFDDPQPAIVAGAVPLRVHVTIVNEVPSGTVTIGLAAGFADSRGNPLAAAWRLHLLK